MEALVEHLENYGRTLGMEHCNWLVSYQHHCNDGYLMQYWSFVAL